MFNAAHADEIIDFEDSVTLDSLGEASLPPITQIKLFVDAEGAVQTLELSPERAFHVQERPDCSLDLGVTEAIQRNLSLEAKDVALGILNKALGPSCGVFQQFKANLRTQVEICIDPNTTISTELPQDVLNSFEEAAVANLKDTIIECSSNLDCSVNVCFEDEKKCFALRPLVESDSTARIIINTECLNDESSTGSTARNLMCKLAVEKVQPDFYKKGLCATEKIRSHVAIAADINKALGAPIRSGMQQIQQAVNNVAATKPPEVSFGRHLRSPANVVAYNQIQMAVGKINSGVRKVRMISPQLMNLPISISRQGNGAYLAGIKVANSIGNASNVSKEQPHRVSSLNASRPGADVPAVKLRTADLGVPESREFSEVQIQGRGGATDITTAGRPSRNAGTVAMSTPIPSLGARDYFGKIAARLKLKLLSRVRAAPATLEDPGALEEMVSTILVTDPYFRPFVQQYKANFKYGNSRPTSIRALQVGRGESRTIHLNKIGNSLDLVVF